tara:strand:- start:73 stop:453 length:381 start_codon:yes stop_codon:yes gene_type:complete
MECEMMRSATRWIVAMMVGILVNMGVLGAASAAMVGTQDALRADHRAEIDRVLSRDEVRQELLAHGVSEEMIDARLSAMTDQELAMMANEFDQLPAGAGVIEVVGIVFIVLLILELVGVTNIFSGF